MRALFRAAAVHIKWAFSRRALPWLIACPPLLLLVLSSGRGAAEASICALGLSVPLGMLLGWPGSKTRGYLQTVYSSGTSGTGPLRVSELALPAILGCASVVGLLSLPWPVESSVLWQAYPTIAASAVTSSALLLMLERTSPIYGRAALGAVFGGQLLVGPQGGVPAQILLFPAHPLWVLFNGSGSPTSLHPDVYMGVSVLFAVGSVLAAGRIYGRSR